MADERLERLAAVLVEYSAGVRSGDFVLLRGSTLAAPLVQALYRRVLEAGGHPETRITIDGTAEAFLAGASERQLDWLNPARLEDVRRADAQIWIDSDFNTRSLSGADPSRQARISRAHRPLMDTGLERSAAGEYRWVVTLLPTQASAQDAEMSLAEYEDFVFRGGLLDRDDPVSEWRAFAGAIERRARWLEGKRELRVVADGTDLTLGVGGRTWVPCGGDHNFPDGEVFTGPVETSVDGEIRFTFPGVFGGRSVEDVRLVFRGGEVVESTARRGEDFLREMIALDDGARRVGEFSFGLNPAIQEFTRNTLFDEKIGGTVHLALGKSYPESGGTNESALHWDLVCDLRGQSEVYADGELVYRNGEFLADP